MHARPIHGAHRPYELFAFLRRSVREPVRLRDEVDHVHLGNIHQYSPKTPQVGGENTNPETSNAFLKPPVHEIMDGVPDVGIIPIEIRLLGQEEMKVIFLSLLVPLPCRA